MFVITKAGGNRPCESLATLCQKKVLHSISIRREKITQGFSPYFLIPNYFIYERMACAFFAVHIPAFRAAWQLAVIGAIQLSIFVK